MKTILTLAFALTAAALSITMFGETDPFGAQSVFHRFTSITPKVAYAVSPSVVDGYQPSAENVIVWHPPQVGSVSMSSIELKLAQEDTSALCASTSHAITSHPAYTKWCK